METLSNFDKFDAPCIKFSDLGAGMGEKVAVGDKIICKDGPEECEAEVIEIDKEGETIYLSKELPEQGELVVKPVSTGATAPYDAMKEKANKVDEEKVLTGPLPELKKFLIQISIEHE